jgi:hypothetical protein
MDFITGLPHTSKGYESIWDFVDRRAKVAHFILVKTTYKVSQLAELYMARIMSLHGVPKKIILDRGSQFTPRFWKSFHENMDAKLNFSSAYHPQTDGQTKRTNQVLEDMLRACALQHGSSWEKSLPYAEFSYNNSYQASLKMSPFEALYGRKCRTPLYWDQTGERQFFGPELIQEAEEQVRMIRENVRIAQSRQKSYAHCWGRASVRRRSHTKKQLRLKLSPRDGRRPLFHGASAFLNRHRDRMTFLHI